MSFRAVPRAFARPITSTPKSSSTTTAAGAVRAYHSSGQTCLNSSSRRAAVIPKQQQQVRSMASTDHAISNPTLASIEKRWESMPPQEQAELWMSLRDRMKVDWHEMTMQEKRAAYWIAFGPHGPRAEAPKGEGLKVFVQVCKLVAISFGVFYATRLFANPPPRTMTKEWQEATNEYAKAEKLEPITGISSEGYEGKGHVQSPPAKN